MPFGGAASDVILEKEERNLGRERPNDGTSRLTRPILTAETEEIQSSIVEDFATFSTLFLIAERINKGPHYPVLILSATNVRWCFGFAGEVSDDC